MGSDSSKKLHQPGEQVRTAGIYRVVHAGHRNSHEVVLKRGDEFPACQQCAGDVRFELLLPAEEPKPGNPSP
jgi:hypothetical protein